jgi:predicted nucleic acid-binding protein
VSALIAIDAGPLIALMDRSQRHHKAVLEFVRRNTAPFMSNLAVIGEAMHMLAFSLRVQTNLLEWVRSGGVMLIEPADRDLQRAGALMAKYADCPMDFADALIVATCERLQIHQVASIDSDFRIYRLHGRKAFHNVLDESG